MFGFQDSVQNTKENAMGNRDKLFNDNTPILLQLFHSATQSLGFSLQCCDLKTLDLIHLSDLTEPGRLRNFIKV